MSHLPNDFLGGERPEGVRPPLHQPPNPADLERNPPSSPDCARVRGWVRDFADGDLEPAESRALEEHVHRCRNCAIELSRAEHEVLRLRQVFRDAGAGEAPVPADLARRIVQRLVLDETSLVSGAALDEARAMAERRADERGSSGSGGAGWAKDRSGDESGLGRPRWFARLRSSVGGGVAGSMMMGPVAQLATVLVLLITLGVCFAVLDDGGVAPSSAARIAVIDATGAFHDGSRVGPNESLGENQALYVTRGGSAVVDWYDMTELPQPAARLTLSGEGNVQLHKGEPQLVNGRVEVVTQRPVSLTLSDGNQVMLGRGQYVIDADVLVQAEHEPLRSRDNGLSSRPEDLRVKVEVLEGDKAKIVRVSGPAFVQAGQVGVYQGSGPVEVRQGGGLVVSTDNLEDQRQPIAEGPPAEAKLSGRVLETSGAPGVGTTVMTSISSADQPLSLGMVTGPDGSFAFPTGQPADSGFAIVLAAPASVRRDLGLVTPEARQLTRQSLDSQLALPIVLGKSTQVTGIVVDDLGQPRTGVQVLPCVFDEVFGNVLSLLTERAFTDGFGNFHIDRLPSRLPHGQGLGLLLIHADFEALVVAVPKRGQEIASDLLAPVVVRHLQQVDLYQLPPNTNIEVIEEIPGVPPHTAAWRRRAMTDNQGRVTSFAVGYGQLWLRLIGIGPALLRRLELSELGPVPRYTPSLGPWAQLTAVFGSLQAVPDSSPDNLRRFEIESSYRYQRFVLGVPSGSGRVLRALDDAGIGAGGGQVFAVEPSGPRGSGRVRFLGFTSTTGALSVDSLAANEGLAVVGSDGGLAFVPPVGGNQSPSIDVTVHRPGRVLLHQSLRPPVASPFRVVTVEFHREGDALPGLAPVLRRFASDSNAWEIDDVPAGSYGAYVNGIKHAVSVPPNGFVILQ